MMPECTEGSLWRTHSSSQRPSRSSTSPKIACESLSVAPSDPTTCSLASHRLRCLRRPLLPRPGLVKSGLAIGTRKPRPQRRARIRPIPSPADRRGEIAGARTALRDRLCTLTLSDFHRPPPTQFDLLGDSSFFIDATKSPGSIRVGIMIAQALQPSLLTLRMSGNDLGDRFVRELARSLVYNNNLRALDLKRNGFTVDGARSLRDALQYNVSLTELAIDHNELGEEGGRLRRRHLGEGSLRHLSMRWCGLTNACGIASPKLPGNTVLAHIDMSHNRISHWVPTHLRRRFR